MSNRIAVRHPLASALAVLLLAGMNSSVARAQSSLHTWGPNVYGALSNVVVGNDFVEIAGTAHNFHALRADGSIVSWGIDPSQISFYDGSQVTNTPTGTGFTQVAGGAYHSLALRADGSIVSWGMDTVGQILETPTGTGFTQISAGTVHSLALRADGSIVSWGIDGSVIDDTPAGTGFTQIDGGHLISVALHADGSVVSWGSNPELFPPAGNDFIQVSSGAQHQLALRVDGSIEAWGVDVAGMASQAPTGTGFVQVLASANHSMALRADGSIVSWGSDTYGVISGSPMGTGHSKLAASDYCSLTLVPVSSGTRTCSGDGTASPCPCGTTSFRDRGCVNSEDPEGSMLAGLGNPSISADTFAIHIGGASSNAPGLLLRASATINGGVGFPVGDGLLCIGGQSIRSFVQTTTAYGSASFHDFRGQPFGLSSNGPGVPTHYQFWYRDNNSCTGAGFNFTNAWSVNWTL